ncbi:MAG: peptidylprolyl isomerase [Tissierellales bacterium]
MTRKLTNKRMCKYILLALSLMLVISITACSNEEIVAKVNDEAITKDDLYELLVEQNGVQALNSLIAEKILNSEVKKQNIDITEEEIQVEINKVMENYGGEETFNQAMEYYGFTLEEVKKNLITNAKIRKLLEPRISITEEEMVGFFEENRDLFDQREQVKASHILVATVEEANGIIERLSADEDFASLAKELSTDEGSKGLGGDLGYFGRGEMVSDFEEAAFNLEIGKISEPVQSIHGFHVIKVADKKEAKEAEFDENKDDIREMLVEEKLPELYQIWHQEKLSEYEIINYLTEK